MATRPKSTQFGGSLIEVLVSILILSFGLLAIGGMMAMSVQLPKLAALRATATNIASNHVDRIRANPAGFAAGQYDIALTYDGTFTVPDLDNCAYPNCTTAPAGNALATMDNAETMRILRQQLPAGGMRLERDNSSGLASSTEGNLWIIWQEPGTGSTLNAGTSDNCPTQITSTFTNPAPRCLYVRFRL